MSATEYFDLFVTKNDQDNKRLCSALNHVGIPTRVPERYYFPITDQTFYVIQAPVHDVTRAEAIRDRLFPVWKYRKDQNVLKLLQRMLFLLQREHVYDNDKQKVPYGVLVTLLEEYLDSFSTVEELHEGKAVFEDGPDPLDAYKALLEDE